MALTDKLSAIGDAIREKTGGTELLTLDAMPTAISSITTGGGSGGGGSSLSPEDLVFTGDCSYAFRCDSWKGVVDKVGEQITTTNVTNAMYMFNGCELKTIPFDINLGTYPDDYSMTGVSGMSCDYMFAHAYSLEEIPKLTGTIGNMNHFMNGCRNVRYINEPDISWRVWDESNVFLTGTYRFADCYSLREIPYKFLKMPLISTGTSTENTYQRMFTSCYVLDSINKLGVAVCSPYTSNAFSATFSHCARLKSLTFYDYDANIRPTWKSQTIDLSIYVGYAQYAGNITSNNSGLTEDTRVTDDTTYQALKDNPDYWTTKLEYSRYNHDSAVETIHSLPDIYQGSSNTIKFKGEAGSATDGGAINTLTEEEIAVATEKGWTVSLA